MIDIDNMSSKTVIKEQYKNTENLKQRKGLHEKYSVNKIGFQKWMFGKYPFRTKIKVLELGSGRGELWNYYFENDMLQDYEMDITLSDFSDGMVDHLQHSYPDKNPIYLLRCRTEENCSKSSLVKWNEVIMWMHWRLIKWRIT